MIVNVDAHVEYIDIHDSVAFLQTAVPGAVGGRGGGVPG
jgi:hypothetical protein